MTRPNAAILFEPSAYDAGQKLVKGRHVAGASFLEGFVRHADVDRYVGIGFHDSHAPAFRRQVAAIAGDDPVLSARPIGVYNTRRLDAIAAVGTYFIPDPQLPRFATARRIFGQRGFSLCGITHTISSLGVMEMLSDLLTAPVQSWDALICTSRAVRAAVLRQQEHYADYIEQRVGKRPYSPVRTPVIPLGVDAGRFARLGGDPAARAALRQRIGAGEDDVVALFFGRLAFHAKAHPVPMYLAAQRAARRLGTAGPRLHLVQTGQFPNKAAEDGYRGGAERFCPDVAVHFLDGADRGLSDASWAAADLFVSLSDNIQESFGITPVEAMAAGLPCLVSDWDGYRDTVVDGETGIRVPTWLPTAGNGTAVADAYGSENLNYDLYVGYTSQMTPVDVPAIADALEVLVRDPQRRRQMGEAGQRRARQRYDWSVVVSAYQELWAELAEARRTDTEIAPPSLPARHPKLADPFDVFGGHASASMRGDCIVRVDPDGVGLDALTALSANVFAANAMLGADETAALVDLIAGGEQSVGECLGKIAPERRVRAVRTLAWLVKYGVATLQDPKGKQG
ncbi:glycosyl transferase [Thalassobaculum fulvum]|uniref:Glycosyl transferase n=1 Tax=Thalassobaculum fulvum TaxID=1633335 RepID=A0A919CR43_9PROT|nr:glycosyltransferase family 4 protein [Thalassobaculum fulvum]GHD57298.1 glycosyl transferase [Thalassobaculum fulvum]